MHGWYFIVERMGNGLPAKIFWVLIEILAIAFAIMLVGYTYSDYVKERVVSKYVFQRGNYKKVLFPSVTICTVNRARRSFLAGFGPPIVGNHSSLVGTSPSMKAMEKYFFEGGAVNESDDMVKRFLNAGNHPENYTAHAVRLHYSRLGKYSSGLERYFERENFTAETFRMAAVQEIGEAQSNYGLQKTYGCSLDQGTSHILEASFRGVERPIRYFPVFHPMFETSRGYCTHIRWAVAGFDHDNLTNSPFQASTCLPPGLLQEALQRPHEPHLLRADRRPARSLLGQGQRAQHAFGRRGSGQGLVKVV